MIALRYHRVVINHLRAAAFVLLAAALVGACSPGDPEERARRYLTSAEEALENGRISEAVIELKNAIQEKADFAPARLALGRLYVRQAQYADAEKELERAIQHGAAAEAAWPALLEALIAQGKAPEALEALATLPDSITGTAEVRALHADALLLQGRREAVRDLLGPADSLSDARLIARAAQLAAVEGDIERARALADRAVAASPPSVKAHILAGTLAASAGEMDQARARFEQAAAIDPFSFQAGTGLAQTLIAMGDLDAAETVLSDYRRRLGDRVPFANLRAMIALGREDFATAKTEAERVLAVAPRFRPALYIAGLANTMLGNNDTAVSQLNRFASGGDAVPAPAYKALAWANLRLERPEEALRVLAQADLPASDLPALRLAVQAALQSGDIDRAKSLLREAVAESSDQTGAVASLAALQIASGETEEARKLLASLPRESGDRSLSDKARLALLHLRVGNAAETLALAEEIIAADETAVSGHVLAGLARVSLDQEEAAIGDFERALELAPGNQIAALGLATLYQRRDRAEDAERVLREALDSGGGNNALLAGLVRLLVAQGNAEEAESLLTRMVEQRADDATARALLARLMLVSGRTEEALPLAREAAELAPESAAAMETLGRAQQAAGQAREALASFERLAELQPDSADARLLLARAQVAAGDAGAGIETLQALLEQAPDRHDARIVLARLLLMRNEPDAASSQIARLKEAIPEVIDVIELEAALALARDDTAGAIAHYRRAFEQRPTPARAVTLARLQWDDGRREAAMATLEAALERPEMEDAASPRLLLAEFRYEAGDTEGAAALYRALVEDDPENALYRNQLAWTLWESGNAEAARPHAEKALELAPDTPEIKDTLGVVLLDVGETERALDLLREASTARPGNPELRFHYAQALAASERSEEARRILTELAEDDGFAQRGEAAALLERLGAN